MKTELSAEALKISTEIYGIAPASVAGQEIVRYNAAIVDKHLAPLLEDRKRKEWLVSHGAYVSHSRDGDVCNVWFAHDPDDESGDAVPVEGYPQKCYTTANEAIDAAMKARR